MHESVNIVEFCRQDGVLDKDDEDIEKLDGLSSKFNNLQNELASNQKRLEENKKQLQELKAMLDEDEDEEVPEDLMMEEQMQQAESAVLNLNAKVQDKTSALGSAHEVKNYIRYVFLSAEAGILLKW